MPTQGFFFVVEAQFTKSQYLINIHKVVGLRCITYNVMVWSDRDCGLSLHIIQPFVAKGEL